MNNIDIKQNFDIVLSKKNEMAEKFGRDPATIKIISVSKTNPVDVLLAAYSQGISIFGENYVQELVEKNLIFREKELSPEWHFIGHLQSNKVKYIAPFITMIHSVDSLKLAAEVSKQAAKHDRSISILLQLNTSGEDSKSGCEPDDCLEIARDIMLMPNVELKGLMTIGTFSDDEIIIRREFSILRNNLEKINAELGLNLKELSMGMSHDFDIAIEEGSTMVRVGTAIFGERFYPI